MMRFLSYLLLFCFADVVVAGTFDDAVTLYLKGFEHCTTAKSALAENNLAKAKKEFAEYEAVRKQAAQIDTTILQSSQRGMDSNLKYCIRVGTDIELAIGTPVLEKGLAECDQSIEALKNDQIDVAKQHYEQYIDARNKALEMSPALTSVFSLKSDMRRCDRLADKIAQSGEQRAAVVQLLESAKDESEAFLGTCTSAQKELTAAGVNPQAIQTAEKAVAKVDNYKKSAGDYLKAFKAKQAPGDKALEQQITSNMDKGEQCLQAFRKLVGERDRQYAGITAELKKQLNVLVQANRSCSGIGALAAKGPDTTRYSQSKTQYESARKSRDAVERALAGIPFYGENADNANVRDVNTQMDTLNRCLGTARDQVASLMPVVVPVAAPVAAPVPVKKPEAVAEAKPAAQTAPAPAAAPASKLVGKLEMSGLVPEFVILYWSGKNHPPADNNVEIYSTGFNKKLFIIPDSKELLLRNSDFSEHKLKVTNDLAKYAEDLSAVGPRQKRTAQISMPENSLAMLASGKDRVVPSYVANILSSSLSILNFDGDAQSLSVELVNTGSVKQGYLLLPDADPLMFEIGSGEEKTFIVTRNKAPIGQLVLKGI